MMVEGAKVKWSWSDIGIGVGNWKKLRYDISVCVLVTISACVLSGGLPSQHHPTTPLSSIAVTLLPFIVCTDEAVEIIYENPSDPGKRQSADFGKSIQRNPRLFMFVIQSFISISTSIPLFSSGFISSFGSFF